MEFGIDNTCPRVWKLWDGGYVMKKKTGVICSVAAMIILLAGGCQKKDTVDGSSVAIYYAAIESGTYYEGWAEQLQEKAALYGSSFEAGYAENSVEAQDAQIKKQLRKAAMFFCVGWFPRIP